MDNPKGYTKPQLLITPNELAQRLELTSSSSRHRTLTAQPPVVIDLRPVETFATGHIPGAAHLDLFGLSLIDTDLAPLNAFLWMIAAPSYVTWPRQTIAPWWPTTSGQVCALRGRFGFSSFFGHPDARLLDGGFGAWERAGYQITTKATPPMKAKWKVGRMEERLATWRDVKDRLGHPSAAVLDT